MPDNPLPMRVTMYSPQRLYGFAEGEGHKVFFHVECFQPGEAADDSTAPPIVGEDVLVSFDPLGGTEERAPRAFKVQRVQAATHLVGTVETFNAEKGWGFIRGEDGVSYHLHRSEVEDGRLPLPGRRVEFYAGFRKGRPRACYVRVHDT